MNKTRFVLAVLLICFGIGLIADIAQANDFLVAALRLDGSLVLINSQTDKIVSEKKLDQNYSYPVRNGSDEILVFQKKDWAGRMGKTYFSYSLSSKKISEYLTLEGLFPKILVSTPNAVFVVVDQGFGKNGQLIGSQCLIYEKANNQVRFKKALTLGPTESWRCMNRDAAYFDQRNSKLYLGLRNMDGADQKQYQSMLSVVDLNRQIVDTSHNFRDQLVGISALYTYDGKLYASSLRLDYSREENYPINDKVQIYSLKNFALLKSLPVGRIIRSMEPAEEDKKLYVYYDNYRMSLGQSIKVIDLNTDRVIKTISLPAGGFRQMKFVGAHKLYVIIGAGRDCPKGKIIIIDTISDKITGEITGNFDSL
jgi:hypothetical protein